MNTSKFKSSLEVMAKHYGCDIELIEQHDSEVVRSHSGYVQYFPYHILKWKTNGLRNYVLLKPKLKQVEQKSWFRRWKEYIIDIDAMRKDVQLYFLSKKG